MQLHCPATGLITSCGHFLPTSKTQVTSLHPLLAMPLSQLNKINHNDNRAGKVSTFDTQMLFCAYLYKTGLIQYQFALPPATVPETLCHTYFELVHRLANIRASNKTKLEQCPKFAIPESDPVKQLTKYLAIVNDVITWGSYSPGGEGSSTDFTDTFAEELAARKKQMRQAKLLRQNRERNLKQLKLWTVLQLSSHKNIDLVTYLLDKPEQFGLAAVKQVKVICLEELPEGTVEQATKKDELIEWLNGKITAKAELNIALASDPSEVAAMNAELSEIENSYKIVRDGEEHINTAMPGARKVTELLAMEHKHESMVRAAGSIATPVAYPKPEDYSNVMAYKVALRKFHESMDKL